MLLRQITDARTDGRGNLLDIVAKYFAATARRGEQAEQHANGGALPRAVSAEKCKHASARHFQVQIVNGGLLAEIARQAARSDGRLVTHDSLLVSTARASFQKCLAAPPAQNPSPSPRRSIPPPAAPDAGGLPPA